MPRPRRQNVAQSKRAPGAPKPKVVVVGLGPGPAELLPGTTVELFREAKRRFVRTGRHPAVDVLRSELTGPLVSFDGNYEYGKTFEAVYISIVEDLVAAAHDASREEPSTYVAYGVPGSPFVAERTVEMLRRESRIALEIHPAMSFLDLAWGRLGIDPVAAGVRLVDATNFACDAAADHGPMLVAQCYSREVLSAVKLAVDMPAGSAMARVVLLHHLGLEDEMVVEVPWSELDQTVEADHLTCLWIPGLKDPAGAELARLDELVRTLRGRCPWDMRQTHGSLARHLLEEAYETVDAIGRLASSEPEPSAQEIDHLEEELGDVLFQVYFHSLLAEEEGRFTLADVARNIREKLVYRHPHVFGDVVVESAEEVASRWEVLKKAEKHRSSVFDGVPISLPSLALAVKFQRKAQSLGEPTSSTGARVAEAEAALGRLRHLAGNRTGADHRGSDRADLEVLVGDVLFSLADLARGLEVDPETALRAAATRFRERVQVTE